MSTSKYKLHEYSNYPPICWNYRPKGTQILKRGTGGVVRGGVLIRRGYLRKLIGTHSAACLYAPELGPGWLSGKKECDALIYFPSCPSNEPETGRAIRGLASRPVVFDGRRGRQYGYNLGGGFLLEVKHSYRDLLNPPLPVTLSRTSTFLTRGCRLCWRRLWSSPEHYKMPSQSCTQATRK